MDYNTSKLFIAAVISTIVVVIVAAFNGGAMVVAGVALCVSIACFCILCDIANTLRKTVRKIAERKL
jgi:hypothetical protein